MVVGRSGIGAGDLVRGQSLTLKNKDCALKNKDGAEKQKTLFFEKKLKEVSPLKQNLLTLVLSLSLAGMSSLTLAQNPPPPALPDNTAVNARDRNPDAMTADKQSNAKSDEQLTAEIRRAVVKDDSLSMLAHNVKIVSANGTVVLRGPVKSEQEKTAIASKAQAIAGATKVDNQLEVKSE